MRCRPIIEGDFQRSLTPALAKSRVTGRPSRGRALCFSSCQSSDYGAARRRQVGSFRPCDRASAFARMYVGIGHPAPRPRLLERTMSYDSQLQHSVLAEFRWEPALRAGYIGGKSVLGGTVHSLCGRQVAGRTAWASSGATAV